MAASAVLTSSVEKRSQEPYTKPVWEIVLTYTITAGDGSAEIKFALPKNGILQKIIAKSGAATGIAGTFTLAIDDNGDNEIFTAAGPAEEATSVWNVNEPISGTIDIGVNPNDDPTGGSWNIVITLRGV